MIAYLDTSALIKLVRAEAESPALRAWLSCRRGLLATSVVGDVEMARTALRKGGPGALATYEQVREVVTILPLTPAVAEQAKARPPQVMRSLDAVHVATALALGADCDVVISYDHRMIEAARAAGLTVASPGADTGADPGADAGAGPGADPGAEPVQ